MTEKILTARDHMAEAQTYIKRRENGGLASPSGPWTELAYLHLRAAEVAGRLEDAEREAYPVVEVEPERPLTRAEIRKYFEERYEARCGNGHNRDNAYYLALNDTWSEFAKDDVPRPSAAYGHELEAEIDALCPETPVEI